MASLYTHQDRNVRKTWFLMGLFFVFVIALGWGISYYYASPVILYIAVGIAIVMNVGSYWYSDKIVLSMYKAREITRESHKELWNIVENLSIAGGLPMPRVYVINDPAPNAFATGRNPEHAAVAFTSGLLERLDRSEIEGVAAHELSHIGNRDILVQTVIVVLVGFVVLLSDFFLRAHIFGGRGRDDRVGGILMLVGLVLAILSPLVAQIIQLAISRKREFLADSSGALLTRYPEGLASALEKISSYKGHVRRANNATAHLFISSPFGGKKKFMSKLFMTHPPIEERIAALRS